MQRIIMASFPFCFRPLTEDEADLFVAVLWEIDEIKSMGCALETSESSVSAN